MADDDSSELSSISSLSAPPSDDESDIQLEEQHGILKFFHKVDKNPALEPKETTPPKVKREPSPPHEYVLADNPDVAFIVMFRARFTDAFPKSLPNFGPQELERDVVETLPGERVEQFLCALLGLLLNRKQDVKPGHYNRALEEAIQSHKGQWAKDWESQNPLSGSATFGTMNPIQRLTLLRTLVQWTLASSDAVKSMINVQYKNRHDEDLNIPLSVQPWGSDGEKRRYFLIEGNDDTAFRVYRESNPAGIQRTWWSIAGTIDELKALGEKLETQHTGPKAKALAKRITSSIPRFEATEEKRRRREYRQMRKEQFKRPEVGMSLYEGRTRGKRMKYTYSEDEEDFYSDSTNRRSTRNTRNHTPAEPSGPVTTASGRQIRAPTRLNAENTSDGPLSAPGSVQGDGDSGHGDAVGPTGRPRRSAAVNHSMNGWATKKRKSQEYDSDDEDGGSSPELGDDEEDEHVPEEEDEEEDEFDEDVVMDDELVEGVEDEADERFMLTFPIRVAFDENNKAKKIPGPPVLASISKQQKLTKHPRAAHRNIIVSDEDDEKDESDFNRGDSTDVADEPAQLVHEPEGPAAEVIAVATKQVVSPPGESFTTTKAMDISASPPVKAPLTPSSGTPTSLAFRGSPEKPQHVAVSIDLGS